MHAKNYIGLFVYFRVMVKRPAIDGGKHVRKKPLPLMYPGGMMYGEQEKRVVIKILEVLSAGKINSFVLYRPNSIDGHVYVYWKSLVKKMGLDENTCPRTLQLLSRAVHIDVSPQLTREDIQDIVEAIHQVAKVAL